MDKQQMTMDDLLTWFETLISDTHEVTLKYIKKTNRLITGLSIALGVAISIIILLLLFW